MFGFIQSPKDSRDYVYASIKSPISLPDKFIYRETPLRDQKAWGTCVGFGSANLKDIQEKSDSQIQVSPLFIYKECKKIDGLPNAIGTTPKSALTVLKNLGVCAESDYPYSLTPNTTNPTPIDKASTGKISAYAQLFGVEDIKQALFQESPVLIGMMVTNAFRNLGVGEQYVTSMFGDTIVGGHCMLLTGYDDNLVMNGKKGFFRLKNSWVNWGNNGYAWLAYDVVTERSDMGMGLFSEAWTTLDIKTGFNGTKIEMQINNPIATVNGKSVTLDQPATILNNRTVVPSRFIAENLGATVGWDATTQTVTITKN